MWWQQAVFTSRAALPATSQLLPVMQALQRAFRFALHPPQGLFEGQAHLQPDGLQGGEGAPVQALHGMRRQLHAPAAKSRRERDVTDGLATA